MQNPEFYFRPPGSRDLYPVPKEAVAALRQAGLDVEEVRPLAAPWQDLFDEYNRRGRRLNNILFPLVALN